MDTEVLEALTDCKKCQFWREYIGKCIKRNDCPEGVKQPSQEVAEIEYRSLI